jgi:hypothetical protein
MALESTQPLTEIITKNLGVKINRSLRLTASSPSVSRFSSKHGRLDISQIYGTSRPVPRIALPFYFNNIQIVGLQIMKLLIKQFHTDSFHILLLRSKYIL